MREESLSLEVRDFGPIHRAEVELRPLTVFVGPSNTGKSYLAMLIYALHRHFSSFNSNGWWLAEQSIRRVSRHSVNQLAKDARKTRDDWAKEDKGRRATGRSIDVLQSHTWMLSEAFKNLVSDTINAQSPMLRMEIERCFGSKIEELTRRAKKSNLTIQICRQLEPINEQNSKVIKLNYSNAELFVSLPDEFGIKIKGGKKIFSDLELELGRYNSRNGRDPEFVKTFEFPAMQRWLQEIVAPGIFNELVLPGHYLPAGRAELLDSYDYFVGSLIHKASSFSEASPGIAGVKADFLRELLGLARLESQELLSKPSMIEEKVLQGSISVNAEKNIKYPRFSYKPADWVGQELPLNNASSMVSEVAPISLYEKHILNRGELLIVDEPESHLHPALQVRLFRQLARLVTEGKRVLVTTHSEWVTEELANIVRRSKLEEKLPRVAEPKPGTDDIALAEADVGVWRFGSVDNSAGFDVREIPMSGTGLYDVGFDDVAISSHNEWARISNALGDSE